MGHKISLFHTGCCMEKRRTYSCFPFEHLFQSGRGRGKGVLIGGEHLIVALRIYDIYDIY